MVEPRSFYGCGWLVWGFPITCLLVRWDWIYRFPCKYKILDANYKSQVMRLSMLLLYNPCSQHVISIDVRLHYGLVQKMMFCVSTGQEPWGVPPLKGTAALFCLFQISGIWTIECNNKNWTLIFKHPLLYIVTKMMFYSCILAQNN